MKKKLLLVLINVLCFSITGLYASRIYVTYITGDCAVDLYGSSRWQDAMVDMDLTEASVVKTGCEGEMEIEIDGNTVSIGPNSTVAMKSLLESIEEKRKLKWLRKATRYTKTVKKDEEEWADMALAGVRGEKAKTDDLEWIEDFEEEELARGRELFEEGQYRESIAIFQAVIEGDGIGAEGGEAAYYLGASLFNSIRYKEALPYLIESTRDKDAAFYESALMNYSFAQYFLRNFREAIEGFSLYVTDCSEGEFVPYALLMLGKCYKDMGMKKEARVYFTRIERDYKDSDVYMNAVEEMKNL